MDRQSHIGLSGNNNNNNNNNGNIQNNLQNQYPTSNNTTQQHQLPSSYPQSHGALRHRQSFTATKNEIPPEVQLERVIKAALQLRLSPQKVFISYSTRLNFLYFELTKKKKSIVY